VMRDDAVTCGLTDRVGEVYERVKESPYGFALVISTGGCVLGRLRASALQECDPGSSAEAVMESGPSTIRLDIELPALVKRLHEREFMFAVVTDPDGVLAGVVRRSDAEAFLSDSG
jgi:CBS domain-containing protein